MSKPFVIALTLIAALVLASFLGPQAGDEPWQTIPAEVQAAALLAASDVVIQSYRDSDEPPDLATLEKEVGEVAYQIVWSYLKQRGVGPRNP